MACGNIEFIRSDAIARGNVVVFRQQGQGWVPRLAHAASAFARYKGVARQVQWRGHFQFVGYKGSQGRLLASTWRGNVGGGGGRAKGRGYLLENVNESPFQVQRGAVRF